VKSSGTWFKDALKKNSFIKINLNSIKKNIKRETKWEFNRSKYYPSIETVIHAIINKKYVLHLHQISVLSYAVLKEGKKILNDKLKGFKWIWINYKKPGLPLAMEIKKKGNSDINIYILQNHGIIYAADTLERIDILLRKIETKLKRNFKLCLKNYKKKNSLIIKNFKRTKNKIIQDIVWNKKFFEVIKIKSLYPDHTVFLNNKIIIINSMKTFLLDKKVNKKIIVIKNYGVFINNNITKVEYEMLKCLAELLIILPSNFELSFLNTKEEKELIGWDKEMLRQKINR